MSYTVWLAIDAGGENEAALTDSLNYTWNMAYAIRHGGVEVYRGASWLYDAATGRTEEGAFVLEGSEASAAATALADCISIIERDADELRKREPANGWGSVDRLVNNFLRPLMEACREYPKATVRTT